VLAACGRLSRTWRAAIASFGLVTASAVLVHLSGGYIELHFHFFVMLLIIALYQAWLPFLLTIGYVALHHGVLGTLNPAAVYNHPAAWAHPWRWAGLHALFVLAASLACLLHWRVIEVAWAQADDEHGRATRLRTLTRLTHLISASLDMDAVLHEIARAATLTGAPVVRFLLADEATHTLEAQATALEATGFPIQRIPFSQGGVGWVATHRRPLNVPDTRHDARFVASDWWHARGLNSFLGLPILCEDALLAVLSLRGPQPFALTPEDQALLESFVAQAAVAIRNASLYAAAAAARTTAEAATRAKSESLNFSQFVAAQQHVNR
jgi:hypothetical protein